MRSAVLAAAAFLFVPSPARADLIRIGDIDGFGYGTAPGFFAANGGPANIGGAASGVLGGGDFLPDINRNGVLANGSNDEFDLRTAAERGNTAVTNLGAGVTNRGTTGSAFTDISLARTYDARSAAGQILVGTNPNTFGPGGAFPHPPSNTLPNQPGFLFQFDVDKGALAAGTNVFFNLVFGDYDVVPASIRITTAAGGTRVLNLVRQGAGSDGLIQEATATLGFGEVFTDGGTVWRGFLDIDFVAPNEPYTAFDYVELSTRPLVVVAEVPEPSTLALGTLGLLAAGVVAIRRRRTAVA